MLKKEFNKKDVNRMRNLITGNVNSSSEIQIGYKKKTVEYKEGDFWIENKKTWTIKNGIKQTISKVDSIRKEIFMPLCCPKCNKVMKHQLDKPNYKIHKKCYNCVVSFENKLTMQGKYDQYEKKLIANNKLKYLAEMESYLLDAVNTSNDGYISEKGEIERWVGGIDKEKMIKDIINNTKEARKKIKKELNASK